MTRIVLILGSAPSAVECAGWERGAFSDIVAINNAWRVREDWDYLIHPEDFPVDRRPARLRAGQRIVTASDYVPLQNALGGFVYAGGTMAFTAGYWALAALRPDVLAFWGCDMVYPSSGKTHFYGTGVSDPLRADISLRNLEAKSARLGLMAARAGCACVNLSARDSRLVYPRSALSELGGVVPVDQAQAMEVSAAPLRIEQDLGYHVASGRYWEVEQQFDTTRIDALDQRWLGAWENVLLPEVQPRKSA